MLRQPVRPVLSQNVAVCAFTKHSRDIPVFDDLPKSKGPDVDLGTLSNLFGSAVTHKWIRGELIRGLVCELSDGKLSDGELSDGELSDGELSDGELSDGELSDSELSDSESHHIPHEPHVLATHAVPIPHTRARGDIDVLSRKYEFSAFDLIWWDRPSGHQMAQCLAPTGVLVARSADAPMLAAMFRDVRLWNLWGERYAVASGFRESGGKHCSVDLVKWKEAALHVDVHLFDRIVDAI